MWGVRRYETYREEDRADERDGQALFGNEIYIVANVSIKLEGRSRQTKERTLNTVLEHWLQVQDGVGHKARIRDQCTDE